MQRPAPSREPAAATPKPVPTPAAPSQAPAPLPSAHAVSEAEIKPPSSDSIDLQWERFQEEVTASHPNIAPFLEMGRLVGIEGTLVTLAFPKQATVARAMLEKPDNLHALSALGERLYGRAIRVRVIEATEDEKSPAPTMRQIREAKEQEQRLVLFQRAKAHPLVKQALEMFGGELTDVRTTAPTQEVPE